MLLLHHCHSRLILCVNENQTALFLYIKINYISLTSSFTFLSTHCFVDGDCHVYNLQDNFTQSSNNVLEAFFPKDCCTFNKNW